MNVPVDRRAFEKLRRIAPNLLAARRDPMQWRARPLPEEVAFKLTNRCDLRCSHCYHWGDAGYHHHLPRAELGRDLSLSVIAKVLESTRAIRSNIFLWGGEPLLYRDWDGLADLLAADQRWTSICSNGSMVERRLDSLLRISSHLEMAISVDGFESDNDGMRGTGAFARTIAGLRSLLRCKQTGSYRGEISVNCVISDALVSHLFEFVRFLEAEGVETVYLSFPWYISDGTSQRMDAYVAEHFPEMGVPAQPSWQSFKFRLDPRRLQELHAELARIDRATWRLKPRYNPALDPEKMREFLQGSGRPAQDKTRCLALRTRLDVLPNAEVVSCKFFPEFSVGNLSEAAVSEVWHGPRYDRVRETLATCGLMPVCAQCNLLYTRGA